MSACGIPGANGINDVSVSSGQHRCDFGVVDILDVDVLDFIDAPLAENTDCRNTGPTLDQVTAAARDQRVRALSIGELNPTRSAGDHGVLPRFVSSIARILAATTH